MPRYIYKYCCGAMYDATHDQCPTCHGASKVRANKAALVIGDDIPGGFVQENFGDKPETFYSKKDMARRAKELGLQPMVRHVDGDKHVTRWI